MSLVLRIADNIHQMLSPIHNRSGNHTCTFGYALSRMERSFDFSLKEELIENLAKDPTYVLFTRDMSKAWEWCNRNFVMLVSRIIEQIDLSQAKPIYPYVKILIDPWFSPLFQNHSLERDCFMMNGCSKKILPIFSINASHRVACYATQVEDSSC